MVMLHRVLNWGTQPVLQSGGALGVPAYRGACGHARSRRAVPICPTETQVYLNSSFIFPSHILFLPPPGPPPPPNPLLWV